QNVIHSGLLLVFQYSTHILIKFLSRKASIRAHEVLYIRRTISNLTASSRTSRLIRFAHETTKPGFCHEIPATLFNFARRPKRFWSGAATLDFTYRYGAHSAVRRQDYAVRRSMENKHCRFLRGRTHHAYSKLKE